jgi:hypothetical protein
MNIELAQRVVDYIEAHPEEHRQSDFIGRNWDNACGTTACICGHAMLLSGEYKIVFDDSRQAAIADLTGAHAGEYSAVGKRLLGISQEDMDYLFFVLQDDQEAVDYLKSLIAQEKKKAEKS